jgi:hypothetical protein
VSVDNPANIVAIVATTSTSSTTTTSSTAPALDLSLVATVYSRKLEQLFAVLEWHVTGAGVDVRYAWPQYTQVICDITFCSAVIVCSVSALSGCMQLLDDRCSAGYCAPIR